MSGAILRRRDRTARSLRVVHYSSAVNTSGGLGPIGFLAMLTLYVMIAYGLMNASFKLIDLLPSAVLDWIGGRGGAGEDDGERLGGAAAGAISRVGALRIGAGPRRGRIAGSRG